MGVVSISKGNSKMGAIQSVSLPAVVTCRACDCQKKCYARKLEKIRRTVAQAYKNNLQVLIEAPDIYWREVEATIMLSRYFRFHVSGDIPNKEYFDKMVEVATRQKHCDILCFTINQFEMCPYAFLLNYIKHTPKKPLFFSDYGSFIHKLIEQYLTGKLKKDELVGEYLARFKGEVRGIAPNRDIFKSYFEQGLSYLSDIKFPYPDPLCVEHKVEFKIGDKPFTGIIDCVAKDKDGIILVDNKSRALKERSKRKKPTKSDAELDEYLRQLYLYSIPIKDTFHCYPARLEFNCYRTGQLISEPFREEELERAKQWAADSIETITNNEDWSPKLDFWKCRYLCDFCDECEYFAMSK